MSTIDEKNEQRKVAVTVKRARLGVFSIKFQWETPAKSKRQTFTIDETVFYYSGEFIIENQLCQYTLNISFSFMQLSKEIQCEAELIRVESNEEVDNEPRPYAASFFINEEETRHMLVDSWGCDHWISPEFNGSFAFTLGKDFTPTAWETTNPNEWKPLTCMLWIELQPSAVGERNAIKQITELYLQQNHCDVQFSFQDDQHIGGHSHILRARSPVFAAMFQHEMKESKTGQVSIQDIQPHIFKQLLHYIYSGRRSSPLTEITAQRLFEAADKYDIVDLKDECVDFLQDCICVDNVINLMAWAHINLIDELMEEALTFTSYHGKQICLLKDWENLMKNYPDVCLEATRRIIDRMSLPSESNAPPNSNRQ